MKRICIVLMTLFLMAKISAQEFDFKQRMLMLNICETLNTAYNVKDAEFVESYFKDILFLVNNDTCDLKIEKSNNYVVSLKDFWKNENCHFLIKDIEIRQSPNNADFFSVSFQHDWISNKYTKNGYMFLLYDLRDMMNPKAHVCVWTTGEKIRKRELPTIVDFPIQ